MLKVLHVFYFFHINDIDGIIFIVILKIMDITYNENCLVNHLMDIISVILKIGENYYGIICN
jgi:hypothetical protein